MLINNGRQLIKIRRTNLIIEISSTTIFLVIICSYFETVRISWIIEMKPPDKIHALELEAIKWEIFLVFVFSSAVSVRKTMMIQTKANSISIVLLLFRKMIQFCFHRKQNKINNHRVKTGDCGNQHLWPDRRFVV